MSGCFLSTLTGSRINLRAFPFLAVLLCGSGTIRAQNGIGEGRQWYCFNRDNVTVISLLADSLRLEYLDMDLQRSRPGRAAQGVLAARQARSSAYLLLAAGKGLERQVFVFSPLGRDSALAVQRRPWPNADTSGFAAFVINDTAVRKSVVFYTMEAVTKLKKRPSVRTIGRSSLLAVLQEVAAYRRETEAAGKAEMGDYLSGEETIRQAVAGQGYNPLFPLDDLDEGLRRFKDDGEVRRLLEEQ